MRIIHTCFILCALLIATPAFAVDDFYGPGSDKEIFDDSRRPDLGIGQRDYDGAIAQPGDGGSEWEEFYVQDLDMGPFMGRLYEVMTNEEWLGQYPEVAKIAEYVNGQGLFNLSTMHTEYAITGDHIYLYSADSYENLDPDSYYAKFMTLPNNEFVSASYLNNDFLLFLGYNNMVDMMMLGIEEAFSSPEYMEIMSMLSGNNDVEEMKQVFGMIEALQLDELLGDVLTGEMVLALYDLPPLPQLFEGDVDPGDFDLMLMIGLADSDYAVEMLDTYGMDVGLMARDYGDDEWNCYMMQGEEGLGLMFNDELAVVSTNIDAARMHLQTGEGFDVEPCMYYFDINFEQIEAKIIAPLGEMAQAELAGEDIKLPTEPLSYLLDLPASEELGHLSISAGTTEDGFKVEAEMKKAVVQYMVYYFGLALCGAGQAGAFD